MATPQSDPDICVCGHAIEDHEHPGFEPQCTASHCTCLHFHTKAPKTPPRVLQVAGQPAAGLAGGALIRTPRRRAGWDLAGSAIAGAALAGGALAVTPPKHSEMSIERLLKEAKKSTRKRTVTFAGKIADLVAQLRERLAAEAEADEQAAREKAEADRVRAQVLEEIAALEAQLAEKKAQLKARRHEAGLPGGEREAGLRKCPDCEEEFDTAQRLGVHRRWTHGHQAEPTMPAGGKRVPCPHCEQRFGSNAGLASHLRSKHGKGMQK